MGEEFMRKQAQRFRTYYDEAFDRMQVPTLLSSTVPEVMTEEFRCTPVDGGESPGVGSPVTLYVHDGAVEVASGCARLGVVDGEELGRLLPALQLANGALRANVHWQSTVSTAFKVRLEAAP